MNEAYNVAIKLSLHNQVSAGLIGMSGQFSKLQAQATALQARLNSIRTLALTGVGLLAGGAIGFHVLNKMIKPASEYQHQLVQLKNTGLENLQILQAQKAVWEDLRKVPTSSVSENVEAIRHLQMVFGTTKEGFKETLEYLPTIQKIQGVLRSVRGHDTADESYELAKTLELKGAVKNPELFTSQANAMTKAIVASGGKVGASDFLMTMKYGRLAAQGWNDEFSYTILPTLIQEMKSRGGSGGGAGGPGNALQSMYAAVVGGTISQKSLKTWHSLDLLDSKKEVWNKVGSLKGVEPGGVKNWQQFMANPFEWSQKTLLPALIKAGYKSEEQQKQAIAYLFPNRTAGFIATQMVEQGWKFKRDQELIKQANGLGSYEELVKNDPQLAAMALHKQWESLMAILGYQVMPALLRAASALIPAIISLSQFFEKNQWAAKALVFSLVGLSAALAIGGTILLFVAAIKGLAIAFTIMSVPLLVLGAPILGIAAALGLLAYGAYQLWQTLKGINFKNLVNEFRQLWGILKFSPIGALIDAFKTLFNVIRGGVSGLVKGVLGIGSEAKPAIGSNLGNLSPKAPPVGKPTASNVHANTPIQVATNINLDGRMIARVVTDHQVNSALSTPNYSQGFDPSMAPTPMVLKGNII
jgi:hypothetical protein